EGRGPRVSRLVATAEIASAAATAKATANPCAS
ncbi:MAG: hypothetical protein JWN61_1463, partial [Pseudonocardiales bacterium]|nr:hypothetical protein [Pseudonocardiales bacterium]